MNMQTVYAHRVHWTWEADCQAKSKPPMCISDKVELKKK